MNLKKLHSYHCRTKALIAPWSRSVPMEAAEKDNKANRLRTWKSFCFMFVIMAAALPCAVESTGLPPWLEEDRVSGEVVTVRVYKDDRLVAEGAGVVISNEGDVLTSAAVLDAGPRVTVVAGSAGELAAVVQLNEKDSGLGILRAEGLSSNGLPLTTEVPVPGNRIFSVLPEVTSESASIVAGAVGEAEVRAAREGNIRLYRHNAMIAARWYGSPVIDECGSIIAVNIPDPDASSFFTVPRKKDPKDVVFALSAGDIASRLESLNIEVVREVGRCISADKRAQQRAQEAEQAQERVRQAEEEVLRADERVQQALEQAEESLSQSAHAQDEAQQSRESEQQAQREAEQARQEAEQARQEAEQARQEAEQARQEAERIRQEASLADEKARQAELEAERADAQLAEATERMMEGQRTSEKLRQFLVWGGVAGSLLLLVILISWLISAKRKRREISLAQAKAADAEREAVEAHQRVDKMLNPAPFDCVLTGEDKSGLPLALSLRREIFR